MDQKLHFWPPGGFFFKYFYARFWKSMQFYPLFMFETSLYLLLIKMVPRDHALSLSTVE